MTLYNCCDCYMQRSYIPARCHRLLSLPGTRLSFSWNTPIASIRSWLSSAHTCDHLNISYQNLVCCWQSPYRIMKWPLKPRSFIAPLQDDIVAHPIICARFHQRGCEKWVLCDYVKTKRKDRYCSSIEAHVRVPTGANNAVRSPTQCSTWLQFKVFESQHIFQ